MGEHRDSTDSYFPDQLNVSSEWIYMSAKETARLWDNVGEAFFVGCQVLHFFYGLGLVTAIDDIVEIEFLALPKAKSHKKFERPALLSDKFWYFGVPAEHAKRFSKKYHQPINPISESKIQILVKTIGLLANSDVSQASSYFEMNKAILPEHEIHLVSNLIQKAREKYTDLIENQISELLSAHQFSEADTLFQNNAQFLNRTRYASRRQEQFTAYQIAKRNELGQEIISAISTGDYALANLLYEKHPNTFSSTSFARLIAQKQIQDFLHTDDFRQADRLQTKHQAFSPDEYRSLKAQRIINYFKPVQKLSLEQALAIADQNQNLLIKARAGSGKTRTLATKVRYLADLYQVDPDKILILAFNKKAATEIQHRIQRDLGIQNFDNARTFHSLAYQLVKPEQKLLFDDGTKNQKRAEFSAFVQDRLREIWDSEFRTILFELFRREMRSIQHARALLNPLDYFLYVRSLREITLSGDRVKSAGEKYIGDFLFEHSLQYVYEKVVFWNGSHYRPDFTICHNQKTVVIEHWGIDPNNPDSKVPDWWRIDTETYRQQVEEKRQYWRTQGISLIETSTGDLKSGRHAFESQLQEKLEQIGIECQKLPQKTLENNVVRIQKDRMTELFAQFIQKAKKLMWSPADVQAEINQYQPQDEREQFFLKMAIQIYSAYQASLEKEHQIDFDDLLKAASSEIKQEDGHSFWVLGKNKSRQIAIKDLQWVLVDEYQDLSFLFFNLLQMMQQVNPQLNLVCVGDDWQAINSFAGSDLKYFLDFKKIFSDAAICHLLMNYRSERAIVESGNALMQGLGRSAQYLSTRNQGQVHVLAVNKVFIELRNHIKHEDKREQDDKFIFYTQSENGQFVNDSGYLQARYLKACYDIITSPENLKHIHALKNQKGEISVAILSRTNRLYRVNLSELSRKLREVLTPEQHQLIGDFSSKIRIDTVHGFKGLEAAIVIILRVNEGSFPLVHPDTYLFNLFGQTEASVLAEERRLFYVALTRASWKTYLLTETGIESDYLYDLAEQNVLSPQSYSELGEAFKINHKKRANYVK